MKLCLNLQWHTLVSRNLVVRRLKLPMRTHLPGYSSTLLALPHTSLTSGTLLPVQVRKCSFLNLKPWSLG